MKIAVRYFTKSGLGNTKKLADAIAKAVGVEAYDLSHPVDKDTDVLFMGSSVYFAGVDKEVKDFIDSLSLPNGVIYNFSTAALVSSSYDNIKKYISKTDLKLSEKEFHCRGQFKMLHKDKPDASDLQMAAEFAKSIACGE